MRHRTSNRSRSLRLLAGTCLAAALVTGCGGGNDGPTTEPGSGSSAPTSSRTSAPSVESGTLPVPPDGPTSITEFPIPSGAEIVVIGPPFGGNWQFGISSPDTATVLEFYRRTLVADGYTVREDVSQTVGANVIEYDLAFYGPTFGIVDANEVFGGTQVAVDERPLQGLEP